MMVMLPVPVLPRVCWLELPYVTMAVEVWCGPPAPLPLPALEAVEDVPRPGVWLVESKCHDCVPGRRRCGRHR